MGWRYRRSIKLMPGVRVNLGKTGVSSFSFGGRGMTTNVNRRGSKTTISLPGTGLSYQTKRTSARSSSKPQITIRSVSPTGSPPASQVSRSLRVYAFVGVVALLTYTVLKPKDVAPMNVASVAGGASSRVTSSPSAPELISSAVAAPVSLTTGQTTGSVRRAVTTTGANLRTQPSRTAPVVRVLDKGVELTIFESSGEWSHVSAESTKPLGWIHNSIILQK